MIVRILGEGQFEVDDAAAGELNTLDAKLEAAANASDEQAFRAALDALMSRIRMLCTALPDDTLEPSTLILPDAEATMDNVREMLSGEGLIPVGPPGLAFAPRKPSESAQLAEHHFL